MGFGGENHGIAYAVQFMALRELDRKSLQRRRMWAARCGYWAGGLLTRWGRALQMHNQTVDVRAGEELTVGEMRR